MNINDICVGPYIKISKDHKSFHNLIFCPDFQYLSTILRFTFLKHSNEQEKESDTRGLKCRTRFIKIVKKTKCKDYSESSVVNESDVKQPKSISQKTLSIL